MSDEISIPVIPKLESRFKTGWLIFKPILLGCTLGGIIMATVLYSAANVLLDQAIYSAVSSVSIFLLAGLVLSFVAPPDQSTAEIKYRKRLNRAIDYHLNKKEIEFDTATVDQFIKQWDESKKTVSWTQAVDLMVDAAREK